MSTRPTAVPALRRGLHVLHLLASRPSPLSASAVARELGIARSSAYEILGELVAAGFAVHLPDVRRWGLGVSSFEIGSAYLRHEPLERVGRPVVRRLAAAAADLDPTVGATAHLGVLHGGQMLYLLKDRRGPFGPTLVTDVGVRLPAPLTATGLSLLAGLPATQIRALFPGPDSFVLRTGRGPSTPAGLRSTLAGVVRRGWAVERGLVTAGTASVAAAALDHRGHPLAAVGVTVQHDCEDPDSDDGMQGLAGYAPLVLASAAALGAAVGGRARHAAGTTQD